MSATTLALPPLRQDYAGGDPAVALAELRHLIESHIANQPRSLQTTIGPSEIGNPCDHCLAAKLAGWQQVDSTNWLAWVGTCVHAGIEDAVIGHENRLNAVHEAGRRYLVEHVVDCGTVAGRPLIGHVDLVDLALGMTVDWKVVGPTTLRKARGKGPSTAYRVQAHTYGKGLVDAGLRIDTVAIAFLPRGSMSLKDAVWWHEPLDVDIAEQAIARANRLRAGADALASISAQVRDKWINALPRDPDCFDCARFPDRPRAAIPTGDPLA